MSESKYDDMSDAEAAIWGKATASEYVKFGDDVVDIHFVNGKINVRPGIGGKDSYEFDVILTTESGKEAKILGTQSKGLMQQLLSFYPLAEKRFGITRSGEGFQTLYHVVEL